MSRRCRTVAAAVVRNSSLPLPLARRRALSIGPSKCTTAPCRRTVVYCPWDSAAPGENVDKVVFVVFFAGERARVKIGKVGEGGGLRRERVLECRTCPAGKTVGGWRAAAPLTALRWAEPRAAVSIPTASGPFVRGARTPPRPWSRCCSISHEPPPISIPFFSAPFFPPVVAHTHGDLAPVVHRSARRSAPTATRYPKSPTASGPWLPRWAAG